MYDRKTWIVVIACSILLAVNVYFTPKKPPAPVGKDEVAESSGTPPETGDKPGSLKVEEPDTQVVEVTSKLETSEAIFTFTNIGGGLKTAEMKGAKPGAEGPVQLNRHGASAIGAIANGPDRIEGIAYEFVPEESVDGKSVVFRGRLPAGLVAKKTWSLVDGAEPGAPYRLDLKVQLENATENTLNLDSFSLFLGSATPLELNERGEQTGAVLRNDGEFSLTSPNAFDKGWFGLKKAQDTITQPAGKAEYAGVANQFFATVIKPSEPGESLLWSKTGSVTLKPGSQPLRSIRAGLRLPAVVLSPGEQRGISYQVFTGPKQNGVLRKMGEDWGDLMNYGMFSPFSRFMNWSLWWIHAGLAKISGTWAWGLSIIVLTILLRTAIWPLYNRSNRTMKRMAKLKPEMDKLKEKYPDDPQKMNQEMMKLYRTYGINPLGGCLPMFAQLPIFFGFYSMLMHAVEMRGQEFLWVHDLALPDTIFSLGGIPINPLPIVMAITSFLQMAMMPNTGGDKTQMMVMKLMPFFFLFICYNFAAALALYWTTSNIFSIFQTWLSNRLPEPELKSKPGKNGKSWVERMAEKADQAQRMRQAQGRVIDPKEGGAGKKRPPRTGG
ncbi:membrane protein insertase YidC [Luteolibacter marinus]|uniref:membrane protein insertase YidC n=1 Tax=Luteolibacter marinus TaxID=2776705 RepID=UPI0018692A6E|nr:membrane protein insertase YidC [Luteolibacter marinus]